MQTNKFLWAISLEQLIVSGTVNLVFLFLCRALDKAGHFVSFWAHVNISYRIVSYKGISGKDFSRLDATGSELHRIILYLKMEYSQLLA